MRALRLEEAIAELADRVEDVVGELADEIMEKVYDLVPNLDERARLQMDESMRQSAYGNVRASLQAFRHRRYGPIEAPTDALEEARAAARAGLQLSDLLAMYRVGQQVCFDRCLRIAPSVYPDAKTCAEALRIVSRFMFGYTDGVMTDVAQVFERERDQYLRSRTQRKVQMIRDILDGSFFDAGELGYDLLRTHVGVVAGGPGAHSALQGLIRDLGVRSLSVAASGDTVWAWLATERLTVPADVGGDLRIGIGDAQTGVGGFRATHGQALAAAAVASRLDRTVCRYDEVCVEAAALGDERAARRFTERELGPLAADGVRNRTLRATILAYLRSAHNASSAAARLGISDRTVAYRLRTCEELLGRPVSARAAELETALRWGRLLGMFEA
ncbi:helix-turn-helix domain-containing protein [Sphaerisporangium fuscum]|uniref:helix-turn-helix domain-containing protein n=1 Tax=Sphaerisporangium fuscum TaxID=2835868 RepID=UPI002029AE41|nr:helix-turn-helix domain-containing protein [Sphaerisporangium fuscum]